VNPIIGKKCAKLLAVILGLTLFLLFTSALQAEVATNTEMKQVCQSWLDYTVNDKGEWAGSDSPYILESVEITRDDKILARAYQIYPDGFVIVPVLMEMPPIKAFSETGHFSVDDQFGVGALICDVLSDRAEKFIELYGDLESCQKTDTPLFDDRNRQAWDDLLNSTLKA